MKNCELCRSAASVFCESDQASLCWDCDSKVHTANFLVAKHSRNLLCLVCHSATSWNASGPNLGKTVSVCDDCVDGCDGVKESGDRSGGSEKGYYRDIDTETDMSDDDCESDEEDEEEEEVDEVYGADEDVDNQVVPWSSTPPPAASSSSDDEFPSASRFRPTIVDLEGQENVRERISRRRSASPTGDSQADFVESSRPLKCRKTNSAECSQMESRTVAIVKSINGFHGRGLSTGKEASATIAEICKLSKDPTGSI